MKVIATNIARARTIEFKGQQHRTGIFKEPTENGIYLASEQVKDDVIGNPKVHGGQYKACYLFAAEQYAYWKPLYPKLDWQYGMFGENLTMEGLDERQLLIGSIYELGETMVQITEPRQPCFKFGVKFGTQTVLQQFIEHGYSGSYVKVLQEGLVQTGDTLRLVQSPSTPLSIFDYFQLLYAKEKNQEVLKLALANEAIRPEKRARLKPWLK